MKIIKDAQLSLVCGPTSRLPELDQLQVAFAGKSNVGKSSLINALMNRKNLARTSSQPGKTQTINFYEINHEIFLVDLPGYGYANVSPAVKEAWGRMIEKYLRTSEALRAVFLLVDIRHAPSENDRIMYDWILRSGKKPVVVATKKDKLKKSQVDRNLKAIRTGLRLREGTELVAFSSETREGRDEVWEPIRRAGEADDTDR